MAAHVEANWHDRLPDELNLKVRKLTRTGYVRKGASIVERPVWDYRIAITNRHDRPRCYSCEVTLCYPARRDFVVRAMQFKIGPVCPWSTSEALVSASDEERILTPYLESLSIFDERGKPVTTSDLQLPLAQMRLSVRSLNEDLLPTHGLALTLIALACGLMLWWSISYL